MKKMRDMYADSFKDMTPRDIADEYYEYGFQEGMQEAMYRMSKAGGGGWIDDYDMYGGYPGKRGAKVVEKVVEVDSSELAELKRLRREVDGLKEQRDKAVEDTKRAGIRQDEAEKRRMREEAKVEKLERLTVSLNLTVQDLMRERDDLRSACGTQPGIRRLDVG